MNSKKLERDLEHRIIGGVCAGLARYLGVSRRLIRLLFFASIFFSFSLTLWIYLILWFLLPARHSAIRENLSRDLRKKARNLDRLAEEAGKRLTLPGLKARLENVQELIENLLPEFEGKSLSRQPELRPVHEAALVHLPKLLENFLSLPSGLAQGQPINGGRSAQEQLDEELAQLEKTLSNLTQARYEQKFTQTADALDELHTRYDDDPTAAFRQQLESLQGRAKGRLDDDAAAKLEAIKGALLAALGRLLETAEPTDPNLYNVRQIALEYLPNTVDTFLALPPAMADHEPLSQGKTAKAVLHEQLDLLDGSLNRLVTSLYQEDAQGLLVHGHFLRDKFLDQQLDWRPQDKG